MKRCILGHKVADKYEHCPHDGNNLIDEEAQEKLRKEIEAYKFFEGPDVDACWWAGVRFDLGLFRFDDYIYPSYIMDIVTVEKK